MSRKAREILACAVDTMPPPLGVRIRARWGGSRDPETDQLSAFVRRGDTVLDVGAHKGVYTWHLAQLVGREGAVYAVEPQPILSEYLQSAFRRVPQVKVLECALSDREGTAEMHIPLWGRTLMRGHASLREDVSGMPIEVKLRQLDGLGIAPPSFIKADVEGHELSLLTGGLSTLRKYMPTLLLEVDRRHPNMSQTHSRLSLLLTDFGYRCFTLSGTGVLKEAPDGPFSGPSETNPPAHYAYNYFFLSDSAVRERLR